MAPLVKVPLRPFAAIALDKGDLITAGTTELAFEPSFPNTPIFPTGTAAKEA